MSVQHVGVIGAGIVGLAVARRITEVYPGTQITVLEKEDRPAVHQTGHNSGVVHAGLYYTPGSLKATLCRRGVDLLKEYTQEKKLPYDECGKLVVAINDAEVAGLKKIQEKAAKNGVPDVAWLDNVGLREIEPYAAGVAALHSPHTAITDYVAVTDAYADDVRAAGGTIEFNFPVDGITQYNGKVQVKSNGRTKVFDRLVVCAGLQSDKVATWAGDDAGPAIVPFRGEYFQLLPERTHMVKGLIYPVPNPDYPFLGVHYTKRVHGGVDLGPNAVLAFAREGYTNGTFKASELFETLKWPGFRKLAAQHWRMGAGEMAGSLSKKLYVRFAQQYVPEIQAADLVKAQAGVRAQAVDRDGSLVDDFRISKLDKVMAVRNAPSPAATSSLAIAEYITDELRDLMVSNVA
ncbi:L-2-hydroxyglutarate oxidase [Kineosporia rhizophila]|uniref:L-2-hydroxyglutarate oxidase n=1 Tax=Kineosporia TaxID=49184 RepID=UPI000B1C9FE7|nr:MULTISPECIES: L-2-hydroxyglutarate oxidase [Kineosporia]MCE0535899.1 L-2-hydroxyglutarate oxidase [Kineosporia rhizophila]GLY14273.1 hydroxyglutarate oxidase [Kineosporia sp. NBRC 101677]